MLNQWNRFTEMLGMGGETQAPNWQGNGVLNPTALQGALQVGNGTGAGSDSGWFSPTSMFGGTQADGSKVNGWAGAALGAGQGLFGAYSGMKQYGLAKDMLATSKDQFNRNFATQQKTLNTAMEDRQRARVASNPGAYQSVGAYMKKNGV